MAARKALLLINPKSRQGAIEAQNALKLLREKGFDLIYPGDVAPNSFSKMIEENHDRVDLVIVGGGDGSLRSAAKGLIKTGLPMGVLPLGTANNFARNLQLPLELAGAVQVISQGSKKRVDVGQVNDEYFLNVSGIGMSTFVNRHLAPISKKKLGLMAYIQTAIQLFRKIPSFLAEIQCEGMRLKIRSKQVTICNGKFYGPGIQVAADASIQDEALDLCSSDIKRWSQAMFLLPALKKGEYPANSGVVNLRGKWFRIETPIPLHVDTDGELTTMTPAEFKVLPKALTVIAP